MEQLQDLSLMSSDPRTIWKELGLSTVEEWWCSKSWQDEPDRSEYCMWWEWPLCYDPLRFISWFFDLFLPFINHSAHVHNIHISHICLATHHTYLPYLLYPNIFLTLWLHIFCHSFLRGVKHVMSFFWWCYAIPYCYTFLISLLLFFRLCTTLCFFLSNKPYCCDHCAITIHHTIKSIKFDVVLFKSASHFHHLPPFYLRGDLLSVFYMNTVMLHFSLTHTHTHTHPKQSWIVRSSCFQPDRRPPPAYWMNVHLLQVYATSCMWSLSFEPSKHTWHCINCTYQTPDTM